MKLRNKKTGEIINNNGINFVEGNYKSYNSLAELNEEWEDYEEEEKEYYTLNSSGQIWTTECFNKETIKNLKSIGNYFETKEEAELAVRKLKAWKRLKDKGFRFYNKTPITDDGFVAIEASIDDEEYIDKDLDLLFGGEE